jgi:formyl-CoA transferase
MDAGFRIQRGDRVTLENHSRPLSGVHVLELANMWAAPFAGHLLSDFGADVVKVEDSRQPDASRNWQPAQNGMSIGFLRVNSEKRAIAVNLRHPDGQALILGLLASFDVVIESFRPGRMDEWGLSLETMWDRNPKLIVLRVSGYGQTGRLRERPGFGTVAEAAAGFAYANGWPDRPPTVAPFGLGDQVAGLTGAFAVVTALFRREHTGRGEEIDMSIYEPMLTLMGDTVIRYSATGEIQQRTGGFGKQTSPRGVYETSDGKWVAIAGSSQSIVERLFEAMGHPEWNQDERYSTNAARVLRDDELQAALRAWVKASTRAEILASLEKWQVAGGPVNDARDLTEEPHFRDRHSIVTQHSAGFGDVLVPGLIAKLRSMETVTERGDAPGYARHTREVIQEFTDLSDRDIERLHAEGVIRIAGDE